jgi:DNA polymerase-3 subunit delta'
MSFDKIRGQDKAIVYLKDVLRTDRLSHAYLFVGPDGVGKSLTAKELAKAINCQEVKLDSCDRCLICERINNFNHPDVKWIKSDASFGSIKIEQVRQMRNDINLTPYESHKKIYIIQEAEAMTEEASNALLKTLEEPSLNSLLILTTQAPERLLTTIVSRCQKIFFSSLKVESVKKILLEDYGLEENKANFLAKLSDGKLGRAIKLRSRDILEEKNRIIDEIPNLNLLTSGIFDIEDQEYVEITLEILVAWFRDILVLKSGLETSLLINTDREPELKRKAFLYSFEELEGRIEAIIKTRNLIRQNINPKLAFDCLGMELTRCMR